LEVKQKACAQVLVAKHKQKRREEHRRLFQTHTCCQRSDIAGSYFIQQCFVNICLVEYSLQDSEYGKSAALFAT